MTAQDPITTLRTVVLQSSRLDISPAARLLRELGHDVSACTSAVDAMQVMESGGGADLLVVDVDRPERAQEARALLETLTRAGVPVLAKAIAVLANHVVEIDGIRPTRAGETPAVRVFLKPLHLHGLLRMVKRLERVDGLQTA